jgi:tetratricopeptide (TPR) repeat protein
VAPFARTVVTGILLSIASIALAVDDHQVIRMNREVERLTAKGRVDDALDLAERAVQLSGSTLGEEHPAFVQALGNLADVCRRMGDDARALELYEKELRILERTPDPNDADLAECLEDLAAVHRATRSLDQAESLYRRALDLREQALGTEDPGLIESLTNLAGLYQLRREYGQAGELLERAVEIREKTLGPDHPELVTLLKFLAAVSYAQEDQTRAKELTERASRIEREGSRRVRLADPERGAIGITAWMNPSAGQSLIGGKGRMYAAKIYFIRIDDRMEPYDIAGRMWPHYSWREREVLIRRATDFVESNSTLKGDVYLLNAEPGRYVAVAALVIDEEPARVVAYHAYFSTEIIPRTEVTVAAGQFTYMGDIRATLRGAPDSSQRYLLDGLPPSPKPVVDAPGLGSVHYRKVPQWVKFEQFERTGKSGSSFWKRARRIFKHDTTWLGLVPAPDTVGDPVDPRETKLAQASQRALDKLSRGDYGGAVEAAEEALATCESIPEAESTCLVPALTNLADILTSKRDRVAAKPLYERALKLREQRLGPGHPAVACSLDAMARLSFLAGESEEAERLERRALEIFEQSLGLDHPSVADSLEFIARLRKAADDDAQAEALMKRALRIREDALGWTHPAVAPLLDLLAQQSFSRNEYGRAAEFGERALAIHERFLGESHPDVTESLYGLGRAYHGLGDYQRATASLERALPIQEEAFGSTGQRVIDTTVALASSYEQLGEPARAGRLWDQVDRLSQQKAMEDLEAIADAMVEYARDKKQYPTVSDIEALRDLLHPVYIRTMPIQDGWGHRYVVESDATTYTLKSLGKDGLPGSQAGGPITDSKADIVFSDGTFMQWPDEL